MVYGQRENSNTEETMGTKAQRQNQHVRRLMMKFERFKKNGKNTSGIEKELAYATGEKGRPEFKTGRAADPRLKKHNFSS